MTPQIIAEVSFNRPQDETEEKTRVVALYASKKGLYLHFSLGKEPDDTIGLVFPVAEFMGKLGQTLVEQEVEDEGS